MVGARTFFRGDTQKGLTTWPSVGFHRWDCTTSCKANTKPTHHVEWTQESALFKIPSMLLCWNLVMYVAEMKKHTSKLISEWGGGREGGGEGFSIAGRWGMTTNLFIPGSPLHLYCNIITFLLTMLTFGWKWWKILMLLLLYSSLWWRLMGLSLICLVLSKDADTTLSCWGKVICCHCLKELLSQMVTHMWYMVILPMGSHDISSLHSGALI